MSLGFLTGHDIGTTHIIQIMLCLQPPLPGVFLGRGVIPAIPKVL